jgi:hypothetical protein
MGHSVSLETRNKISLAQIGKIVSSETKEKISAAQLGKKLTEQTKEKISISNLGKILSQQTKEKLSKSIRKFTDEQELKIVELKIVEFQQWNCQNNLIAYKKLYITYIKN